MNNYVKKKAHHEIIKTKGINRDNKYHQQAKGAAVKKEKKEEESSSSGVEEESAGMKEEWFLRLWEVYTNIKVGSSLW